MTRLLRVTAPHFVAGAEWRRESGVWTCYRSAPILRWMVGKSAESTARYLAVKGWRWEWL